MRKETKEDVAAGMATRSRSERDEGSSCFFFGVLGIVDNVEDKKNESSSFEWDKYIPLQDCQFDRDQVTSNNQG